MSTTIEQWLPSDTFFNVDRSIDRGTQRLSGIRLPLSEAETRRVVTKYRIPEPPEYNWFRIQWGIWQPAIRWLDELDAKRAWENEGGR